MAKSIKTQDLIEKNRLASLEFLIYNYIGKKEKSVAEIHTAFKGLASVQTIKGIARVSSFMKIDNSNNVKTLDGVHLANVTYDFESQNPGTELFLSGMSSENGQNKTRKDVPLTIGSFAIDIHIVHEGVGNWTLNIKKIDVTTGFKHKRKIDGDYPKNGNNGIQMTFNTNSI